MLVFCGAMSVSACRLPGLVDELVDQHPVADHQGVLHRSGGDEERLEQEGTDQHGEAERDDQQQRQLLPQRHVLAYLGYPVPPPARPVVDDLPATDHSHSPRNGDDRPGLRLASGSANIAGPPQSDLITRGRDQAPG